MDRMVRFGKSLPCIGIILLVLCASVSNAADGSLTVLKISPQDQRAVIRTAEGKMRIIKVGDVIRSDQRSALSGQTRSKQLSDDSYQRKQNKKKQKSVADSELRVVEIAEGRVVFEEKQGDVTEMVIIRLADAAGSGSREQNIVSSSGLRVVGKEARKTAAPQQKIERIRKTGERQSEMLMPSPAPAAEEGKRGKLRSRFN